MAFYLESGYTSLNKKGEELCGDKVESVVNGDYTTLVLADGMGSGVKANILATLTSKILCTMVAEDIPLDECIETIIQSLPVCKVRGVAYATFSVIHLNRNGEGYLVEFDNPQAIFVRDGKCGDLEREELNVLGKKVYKSALKLKENDAVLVMSDGTIHAGIGMLLNFGWERKEIKAYLDNALKPDMSARCMAWLLANACNDLYMDKPGDDTTVAAVKLRREQKVNLMIGPPVNKDMDEAVVNEFMSGDTKKVVCGGTSSQIVARCLNTEVRAAFEFPDKDVPPIGYIDGIDLTTEGVLTMRRLLTLSQEYLSEKDLHPKFFAKRDGASLLADMLFEKATHVNFFVGQGVNAAHQELPIDITMKLKLVESLTKNLEKMGKTVSVKYN